MRVALIGVALVAVVACGDGKPRVAAIGDPEHGKLLLRQFGCGACHEIPEVANAQGRTGPPLKGVGTRAYLGGSLPNSPENLAAFIQAPERYAANTTMPNLGVTAPHARDMAAYLATLR